MLRKTGFEIMKALKTSKPVEDAVVYQYILKKESEGKTPDLLCQSDGGIPKLALIEVGTSGHTVNSAWLALYT